MIFRFTLSNDTLGSLTLPHDPVGWDDVETTITRGMEYHGLFYEQTANLKYYCTAGKEFIQSVYDIDGIEGVVRILIEISCPCQETNVIDVYSDEYTSEYGYETGTDCDWKTLYEGVLDFNTLEFQDEYVSCKIINDSFFEKVRNRLDSIVTISDTNSLDDITISTVTPYNLNLHSKTVQFIQSWEDCGLDTDISMCPNNDGVYVYLSLPMVTLSNESGLGYDTCGYISTVSSCQDFLNDTFKNSYIFRNETNDSISTNFNINIDLDFNIITNNFFSLGPTTDVKLILRVAPILVPTLPVYIYENVIYSTVYQQVALVPSSFNITYNNTLSINVPSGFGIFIYFSFGKYFPAIFSADNFNINGTYNTFDINFNFLSTITDSNASVYQNHDIGHQIARAITSQNDSFRSEVLGNKLSSVAYGSNGCHSFNAVTNGFKIRQYNKPLRTSMSEWFRANRMLFNLGLGIEQYNGDYVVRVEPIEYFYDKQVSFTFDYVPEIKTTIATDLYFNNINIGYEDWTVENVSGLDEYNTKRQFNTGIRKSTNTVELISPYIAGGYAIEFTRRNGIAYTSDTDWKYDNNNFIIALNRSVDGTGTPTGLTTAEKDENFSTTSNILVPSTTYNLRLAPSRALTRHLNWLGSMMYRFAGREIKFTYGEANTQAEYTDTVDCDTLTNELFTEGNSIVWDSPEYSEPIWIPEYVEFEYPLTFNQWLDLKTNPKMCIAYSNSNTGHEKGFIISVSYKPTKGIASFKLLKAYDN